MSDLVIYLGAFGNVLIMSCKETGVKGYLTTRLLLALRSKTDVWDYDFSIMPAVNIALIFRSKAFCCTGLYLNQVCFQGFVLGFILR